MTRQPGWHTEFTWLVAIVTVVGALLALVPPAEDAAPWSLRGRRLAVVFATVGVLGALGGPAVYAVNTIATAHTGGNPSVDPLSSKDAFGMRGGSQMAANYQKQNAANGNTGPSVQQLENMARSSGMFGTPQANPQLNALLQSSKAEWPAAVAHTSAASSLELQAHVAVMGLGGFSNDPTPTLQQFQQYVAEGKVGYLVVTGGGQGGGAAGGTQGGAGAAGGAQGSHGGSGHGGQGGAAAGGAQGGAKAGGAQGGAAAGGAQGGAGAAGGFGGFGRNSGVTADIQNWVQKTYPAQQVGNATVYDLQGATLPGQSNPAAH